MLQAKFPRLGCIFLLAYLGLLAACSGISSYKLVPEAATEEIPPALTTDTRALPQAPTAVWTTNALANPSLAPDTLAVRLDQDMRIYHSDFSGTVLVARRGQVLLSRGYGLADREQAVPNTPQTKFRIGSVTKSFTAMAIMLLQERGLLSVQDSICDYISNCPGTWRPITLHQLLNHTAGIPDYPNAYAEMQNRGGLCQDPQPADFLAYVKDLPLAFPPGDQFHYSSSGYYLLGMVIENVSGQPYDQFVRSHILQPLGMTESGYEHADATVKGQAWGYSLDPDSHKPVRAVRCDDNFAVGGLYSTTGDLYKWDQALYTSQLVSTATLNTIFTSTVSIPSAGGVWNGVYGYGWMISNPYGHRIIWHNGLVPGFAAQLNRYPDDRVTIIALSNVDATRLDPIIRELATIVFEEN